MNPAPSPATRFKPGKSGNPSGRMSVKWLKDKVDAIGDDGQTKLEEIADHLIEVATKWEIIRNGEEIPVASARDSIEASRLILQVLLLIHKAPPSDAEHTLKLAEHFVEVSKLQVEVGLKLIGSKLDAMTDEQKLVFWERCEKDPRRFLDAAMEELEKRKGPSEDAQPAIAGPPDEQPSSDATEDPKTPENEGEGQP